MIYPGVHRKGAYRDDIYMGNNVKEHGKLQTSSKPQRAGRGSAVFLTLLGGLG